MSSEKVDEKYNEKDTDSIETKEVQDLSPKVKAREGPRVVLDAGSERVRFRKRWYQLWSVLLHNAVYAFTILS